MFKVFQITPNGESSNSFVLSEPSQDVTRTVKRRNRVLQSCIPCHEMRRKCDRKRPCSRCVDQGLGDQCVYQLEDPAYRQDGDQDEATRLRRRIMDLEKTVKVLMERPMARDTFDMGYREVKPLPKSLRANRSGVEGDENRWKRLRGSPSEQIGQPQSSVPTLTVPAIPSANPGSEGMTSAASSYPYYSNTMPPPQLTSISHASDTYPSCNTAEEPSGTRILDLTKSQLVQHCGCAHTTTGRDQIQALQNKIGPLLSQLNNLPEHQQSHTTTCGRLIGLTNVDRSLRAALQARPPSPPQFMYTVSDETYHQAASEGSPTSLPPPTSYGVPYHPPHSPHSPHSSQSPPFTLLPYFLSSMAHAAGYEQHHGHTSPVGVDPTPRSYSNYGLEEHDIKPFYTPSTYGLVAATSSL